MASLGSKPALLAPRPARGSECPLPCGAVGRRRVRSIADERADTRPWDKPEKELATGRGKARYKNRSTPGPPVQCRRSNPRRGGAQPQSPGRPQRAVGPSPAARGGRCPRAVAGPGAPSPALRPPPAYKEGGPGLAGGAAGTVSADQRPVGASRSLLLFLLHFSFLFFPPFITTSFTQHRE